jgi:DNA-binding response OmpR family regulator
MKILLADSDTELTRTLSDALRLRGHQVVVADDGLQALKTWNAEHPDLTVLDRRLPSCKGMDVLRAIR